MSDHPLPILGFIAFSGTGKTTLLEAVIPLLKEAGIRVGLIKHAHHEFDIDVAGKDSYRLRKAGANQVLISSRWRNALISETPTQEADFKDLLSRFDTTELDLILIEGFKQLPHPKIEVHRKALNKPWRFMEDSSIIALACDSQHHEIKTHLPLIDINQPRQMAHFIHTWLDNQHSANSAPSSCCAKTDATSATCDALSPAMMSVEQARSAILTQLPVIDEAITLPLNQALNYTLAQEVRSNINVPAYTNSAMDGYAISSQDIELNKFKLKGTRYAGADFAFEIQSGECVKIMTGAPMPANTDTVVMREQATEQDGWVYFDRQKGAIKPKQNVRQAGEDLPSGAAVFSQGTRLRAPELGMLASIGADTVTVKRQIKVALFSTGDEVLAPGSAHQANKIYDANRYTLHALLTQLNCDIIDLGIIEDSADALADALNNLPAVDVIISSGGVSVGDADFVKDVLAAQGEVNFWRVNMRPGRPLAFGKLNHAAFFGLPGNPVAAMVVFLQFVEPAICRMQGEINWQPPSLIAQAAMPIRSKKGRTEFSRGIYWTDNQGQLQVKTTGSQGSGILRSMSEANCLIEITPEVETAQSGDLVRIYPLFGRV